MPHQKNPVESLREEIRTLIQDNVASEVIYQDTYAEKRLLKALTDLEDALVKKLSTQREQILVEILEKIGADVEGNA